MMKKSLLLGLLMCCFQMDNMATVVTVYVYNTEFSLNLPGQPIVTNAVITAGDTIHWQWVQGGHTTTAVAGSPEQWNEIIDQNNPTFDRQFNVPGVYWYYCIPHGTDDGDGTASGMSGTITVTSVGVGACCLPNASCYNTDEADCLTQGGTFSGPGTFCEDVICSANLTLGAVLDNTLYESVTGTISNGLGQNIFAGTDNNNNKKRAVISFDISTIPAGAVIESATLRLHCNTASNSAQTLHLHKLLQTWGEGTSDAGGGEQNGTTSTTNDATWIHRFYNTLLWNTPGGDYEMMASASTIVQTNNVYYDWTGSMLAMDVQHWVDNPGTNAGWILIGNEAATNTYYRFDSRNSTTPAFRPQLILTYYVAPMGACCMPDASCFSATEMHCNMMGGYYQGDNTDCGTTSCSFELTPFIDPLPLPAVAQPASGTAGGAAHYEIGMTEQFQQLHSELPPTRVWGYNGTYPGPTIEAFRNQPVTVIWNNNIRVAETNELRTEHVLAVDTCLHGPDMTGTTPVAVVHLHGGKVAPDSDGDPDLAFPPGESSPLYTYPNSQPAATIWYHDHGLGITRLNVMMGLAGFYIIRDSAELALNLPSGEYDVPLAIQDRSFNSDGSLRYNEHWHEHFFGDVILVNGKVWPYHQVKQGKYRFRMLNGSNSRTYTLSLSNGATFTQIGTDLGLMETPVTLSELTITPGERADVIIDFSSLPAGTEIILQNSAPAPFPGFPGVGVVPDVMKFIVTNEPGFTGNIPAVLSDIAEMTEEDALTEREFNLVKMPSHGCGMHEDGMWTINGLMWDDITEYPVYGTTEIWSWVNVSGITHPMHMHLVMFQILDRIPIDPFGNPTGPPEPPALNEKGWKDTANCPSGYKTRVIAQFIGFTGQYPYHCHILEHEDHEMMRQFEVIFPGCTDPSACNYEMMATQDDGSCDYTCYGCTDPAACNYDVNATIDNGTCDYTCYGCTDPTACNYDINATIDDGTCDYTCYGCTDPTACNYDMNASIDDGTCDYTCYGCMDPAACNYDVNATIDNGTCDYTCYGCTDPAACNYDVNATIDDGTCDFTCYGCMDPAACNYDMNASIDDGTCDFTCYGCTDPAACNYDMNATIDDGTCDFTCYGCTDPAACNYNMNATIDDGTCDYTCYGCMDPAACNYNMNATIDDGSCDYTCYGCTDPSACNYNVNATIDDGTCEFTSCNDCPGDLNGDNLVNTVDLLLFLSNFGCTGTCSGDINDDELVNTVDLLLFLSNFGNICP